MVFDGLLAVEGVVWNRMLLWKYAEHSVLMVYIHGDGNQVQRQEVVVLT